MPESSIEDATRVIDWRIEGDSLFLSMTTTAPDDIREPAYRCRGKCNLVEKWQEQDDEVVERMDSTRYEEYQPIIDKSTDVID